MKRVLRTPVLVILLLMFPFRLWGQERKTLIRLNPFTITGLGYEERHLIESLIRSYLADFGEVVTYYDTPSSGSTGDSVENLVRNALEAMDSLSRTPEYIISGSIYLEQDNRIFTLEITKTSTGVNSTSISAHRTTGELVLKARSLVESILAPEREETRGSSARPEFLSAQGIVGTWRGETGVEMIRLYQGGQGIAIFSSGAQMPLSYTIQNNTLLVKQASSNTERYYHPLPYGIARQLSSAAEPIRWELFLYERGTILRGQRFYTGVNYEGDRILEFLPGLSREAEWVRIH